MTLGERIKFVRKSNKLNQADFAKKLGISQTHVSKIEKNIENPSETLLRFTSYMFAINIEWLKTGSGTPSDCKGFYDEYAITRSKLEDMMKYMNDQQTFDFLYSFKYFSSTFSIFFDDKNGFDDEYLTTFEKVLNYIFILALHAKTTDDKSCESQVTLLKNSVDNFIETILKK